jgi:hypothetical protein
MGDFSRAPSELLREAREKGYVGLHIEQGVPLLDRDLNLLQDLVTAGIRSLFGDFVGDGVAHGHDGFAITAVDAPQDFRIGAGDGGRPGSILVQGLQVFLPGPVTYTGQPVKGPALTTPDPAGPGRVDVVHVEAWLDELDGTPELDNRDDVGMQTSTRLVVSWRVRVTEGTAELAVAEGHVSCPIAELRRTAGADTVTAGMIVDRRLRRLTVADVVRRLSLVEEVLLRPAFTAPEFTPRRGGAGSGVEITGTNLDVDNVQVFFGDVPARITDNPTPTKLLVQVPNGLTPDGQPRRVHLALENRGGRAESTEPYLVNPVPVFAEPGSQFTPTTGPAGTEVTLAGFNFDAGTATARMGGLDAPVVGVPGNTTMVIRVPSGVTTAEHRIELTVGGETVTSTDTFTVDVDVPPPVFVSPPAPQFDPPAGANPREVTLRGRNFGFGPVRVFFGTTETVVVGTPTSTAVVAVVPTGIVNPGQPARRVFVRVRTAGGEAESTERFRVEGQ